MAVRGEVRVVVEGEDGGFVEALGWVRWLRDGEVVVLVEGGEVLLVLLLVGDGVLELWWGLRLCIGGLRRGLLRGLDRLRWLRRVRCRVLLLRLRRCLRKGRSGC